MKRKQLVSLIAIVILLLTSWLFYTNHTDIPQQLSGQPVASLIPAAELPATTTAESISDATENHQPLPDLTEQQAEAVANTTSDKSACDALSKQIDTHPLFKAFIAWNEQVSPNITHTLHDERSMEQLMLEAQAGDVLAMRTLSRNYRWYALYGQYRAPDASQEVDPDIDTSAMAKARYWMEQAGLHGYAGAFLQLAMLTLEDTKVLSQAGKNGSLTSEEIADRSEEYTLRSLAYLRLSLQMMPKMRDHLYALELMFQQQSLSSAQQQQFDAMYQQLELEWRSKREQLGFPAELDIEVPAEFAELVQLHKTQIQCTSALGAE